MGEKGRKGEREIAELSESGRGLKDLLRPEPRCERLSGIAGGRALAEGVPRLALRNIEAELPKVQRQIVEARRLGDDELAIELTHKLTALTRGASKLKQRRSTKG